MGLVRAAQQDLAFAGCYLPMDLPGAFEVLRSRHFDGVILDCRDASSAKQILARIREGPSNRQSPVIAVINGTAEMRVFLEAGANFFICRPISAETVKAELNKALDAVQKEYRRYFRHQVNLPLLLGIVKDGAEYLMCSQNNH